MFRKLRSEAAPQVKIAWWWRRTGVVGEAEVAGSEGAEVGGVEAEVDVQVGPRCVRRCTSHPAPLVTWRR